MPWWQGLDLRVLRHVRGVLRRRGLELTLVEHRPEERAAFAPLIADDERGAGLAVIAPELSPPELALIESMLGEAALDVAAALRDREPPREAGARTTYLGITGGSATMQELYSLIDRVAPSDSTVLIQGENGTGKELVARAIHERSVRAARRFVVTNCSAFNDNLLDSELFGHKRGAFTGAVADKPGLFETADLGTFFLDEIGDMSPALQVKVLRVLQEGTFNRVGDTETRKVDVRIIAATNRDLRAMVADGRFREDLFYRINVINVNLPALRDRRDDVPLLIQRFLARHRGGTRTKRLSDDCQALLAAYAWPGNVRELENEIERLVVLAGDTPTIGAALLSPRIRNHAPDDEAEGPVEAGSLPAAVEALERRMIGNAMRRHAGNKTRAAEDLKVSRRNLIRLVQKYRLE
ncbi:MAG TPA: sigma 54-interacting transcriptional regulator [Kofleriaceae bacterium]|nr:sigma 54-interacting transcriptional regulator [Kofleriaceae bacterium]